MTDRVVPFHRITNLLISLRDWGTIWGFPITVSLSLHHLLSHKAGHPFDLWPFRSNSVVYGCFLVPLHPGDWAGHQPPGHSRHDSLHVTSMGPLLKLATQLSNKIYAKPYFACFFWFNLQSIFIPLGFPSLIISMLVNKSTFFYHIPYSRCFYWIFS